MARTVAQIQAQIIANIQANQNLTYQDADNITRNITYNTSKRSIWQAWTWIVAAAIAVMEQLQDVFLNNVEAQVALSAAATPQWIQAKMFAFQYDDSGQNPQIVQLLNLVPQYEQIIPSMQIITACSVTVDITNTVNVLVAKTVSGSLAPLDSQSSPPAASGPELSAAQSYLDYIGVAGVNYKVQSMQPDLLFIQADIYYNGMYSTVIQNNVITAINNYLLSQSTINLNGVVKVSDLEAAILATTGVNDVVIYNLSLRTASNTFSGTPLTPPGTILVSSAWSGGFSNPVLQSRQYATIAGYVIGETTTGYEYGDTNPITGLPNLNFVAQ